MIPSKNLSNRDGQFESYFTNKNRQPRAVLSIDKVAENASINSDEGSAFTFANKEGTTPGFKKLFNQSLVFNVIKTESDDMIDK